MLKRTIGIGKVTRAQRLNASVVVTIEGRRGRRASGRGSGVWRTEPKTDVEGMDRRGSRVYAGIGKWTLVMHDRCGADSRSHDEGFNAESANEVGNPLAVFVRREVALVPGQTKGRVWELDYEGVEFGLWRQAASFQVHDFHIAERVDCYSSPGVRNAVGGGGACRAYHVERCVLGNHGQARKGEQKTRRQ